jgi:hypothetical protein
MTEIGLLGNVAYRAEPGLRMLWDAEKMLSPNCSAAAQYVRREYRKGWTL